MRSIAITNQKGGVAKTTTAVNLGACLAERGKRVLLIDLDPQANLTSWLGLGKEENARSIYDVFVGDTGLNEVLVDYRMNGLRVAPSVVELAGAERLLSNETGRDTILKRKLAELPGDYDYVLFDCPPSLGVITINALAAAKEVFIPVETKILALNGLVTLTHTIQLIKDKVNPSLEVTGIVACMYDGRTNLSREVVEKLRAHFGDKVFKTVIRENIRLAECPISELPIHLYAPGCAGAKDYESLADEVIASEKTAEGPADT
ncbi:MAG: ParA family protein [Candidatus Brocadiales bacterium]|nr:ParA family protein [Candidatus Bathyanammoxibius sp.]